MNYISWSEKIIEKIIYKGFDPVHVKKSFDEAETEIKSEYEKGELNSAGACFIAKLLKYDLDLEIGSERGKGRLHSDLTSAYKITKEQLTAHSQLGFIKKVAILTWFRGDEIDLASYNFPGLKDDFLPFKNLIRKPS